MIVILFTIIILNIILYYYISKIKKYYYMVGILYIIIYSIFELRIENNILYMLFLNLLILIIQSIIYILFRTFNNT